MRALLLPLALLLADGLVAQVRTDQDVRLTGPDAERRITGLAAPADGSSAIPVSVIASGTVHWASASHAGGIIELTLEPALSTMADGLLVRFASPVDNTGPISMHLTGTQTRPVVRTDGRPLNAHALRPDRVAEVLFDNDRWVLLNPNTGSCPPGTVRTAGPVCMDVEPVTGLRFYQAIDLCASRSGKLCAWDEYAVGCALRQGELNRLFVEWEWIDGSSNHTHTANQAGRYSCQSQRSASVVVTMTGHTRCCYQTR
ncbi:MAG: hypothetical protein KF797_09185 [Flavobacteriales bacterium]|nr:hypothetical protein [Flavobacteriales bacterium]